MSRMLYRSPDVLIDGVAWHVIVYKSKQGKAVLAYRFRRSERHMWSPITSWPGRLPKGLAHRFTHYRQSINVAIANVDLFAREAA